MKLDLFGIVGEYPIDAERINFALMQAGNEPIEATIFSPGGSYYVGEAIHSLIKAYEPQTSIKIIGIAASAATRIMLAFDKITIEKGSFIMIHNPAISAGRFDYVEAEKKIDYLKSLAATYANAYSAKTGLPVAQMQKMMDEETYLSAEQALEMGFVDEIVGATNEIAVAASMDFTSDFITAKAPKEVQALFNQKQQNQKNEMKKELIAVLAMDATASEDTIIESVKAFTTKVTALTDDIQAKTELITGLNAKIEANKIEVNELKAQVQSHEAETVLAELISKSGKQVSDEVKAKLEKRVKSYLADTNAESKADRMEDMKLYVNAYGIKSDQSANTKESGRANLGTESSIDLEHKIVARTNEIMETKKLKISDYANAYAEASEQIKLGK